jgi:hypothetical protein
MFEIVVQSFGKQDLKYEASASTPCEFPARILFSLSLTSLKMSDAPKRALIEIIDKQLPLAQNRVLYMQLNQKLLGLAGLKPGWSLDLAVRSTLSDKVESAPWPRQ